jgi:hypothetical protein
MQIRIDHHDGRIHRRPFKLVFLDLERKLAESELPVVTAWENISSDRYPAMRVNMRNAPSNGSVWEIPDEYVSLKRYPYIGKHSVLNSVLVFVGLLSALEEFRVTAADYRERGQGSEIATRVRMADIVNGHFQFPEEIPFPEKYYEGAIHRIPINKYERNPKAREKCLQYWGRNCSVCEFNFGKVYGFWAEGYIQVHHLKPLSEISEEYEIDPIADLRPVCLIAMRLFILMAAQEA